jgi:hypothetical protein
MATLGPCSVVAKALAALIRILRRKIVAARIERAVQLKRNTKRGSRVIDAAAKLQRAVVDVVDELQVAEAD